MQHRQQLGTLGVTGARQRLRGRVQELVGEPAGELFEMRQRMRDRRAREGCLQYLRGAL